LDFVGPQHGWLSAEYMEELSYIDEYLTPLIESIKEQKNFLIIITSDHAGHGKIQGTQHPDDYNLPFIINSDTMEFKKFQNVRYYVTDLKHIVDGILK
ncbi:MAG: alkaline phosphatase family protein, partial [Deltaproteobacteria bacterium]|nr:alkaline phosphatase family protein [Deltaproteobacteria bacterium]